MLECKPVDAGLLDARDCCLMYGDAPGDAQCADVLVYGEWPSNALAIAGEEGTGLLLLSGPYSPLGGTGQLAMYVDPGLGDIWGTWWPPLNPSYPPAIVLVIMSKL